jgi:metallo-beta-lactamase family protein
MKDDHYPFPSTNYIVTESTYGSRVRYVQSSEDRITTLARVLNKTLNQENGKVLIPTFAFHRMQELIADLCVLNSSIQRDDVNWDNKDRDITVLCHSGLSNRLNAIYARSLSKKLANGKYQYLNNVLPERLGIAAGNVATIFKRLAEQGRSKFGNITFVTPSDGDKTTLIENADIILATSGMCESGAASDYFEMLKDSPANSVVITGFQSSGSVGRRLVDGDLEALSCRLDVHDMSAFYSAHGDQTKLLENIFYLGQFKSNSRCATVFINHGDAESKNVLRSKIMQISQDQLANYREVGNVLLASNRWFDLNHGEYLAESTNKMIDLYALSTNELLQEIERRKFALT